MSKGILKDIWEAVRGHSLVRSGLKTVTRSLFPGRHERRTYEQIEASRALGIAYKEERNQHAVEINKLDEEYRRLIAEQLKNPPPGTIIKVYKNMIRIERKV